MSGLALELGASKPDADGGITVRLLVVNTGYDVERVDRRLLWGPHPESGTPGMLTAEPSMDRRPDETVALNPGGVFGRERRFRYEPGEQMTFHGYLLRRKTDRLLPGGPGDSKDLAVAADPLTVRFD